MIKYYEHFSVMNISCCSNNAKKDLGKAQSRERGKKRKKEKQTRKLNRTKKPHHLGTVNSKAEVQCHSAPCWEILEVASCRQQIGLWLVTERGLCVFLRSHFSKRNTCVLLSISFYTSKIGSENGGGDR